MAHMRCQSSSRSANHLSFELHLFTEGSCFYLPVRAFCIDTSGASIIYKQRAGIIYSQELLLFTNNVFLLFTNINCYHCAPRAVVNNLQELLFYKSELLLITKVSCFYLTMRLISELRCFYLQFRKSDPSTSSTSYYSTLTT